MDNLNLQKKQSEIDEIDELYDEIFKKYTNNNPYYEKLMNLCDKMNQQDPERIQLIKKKN